MPTSKKPAAKAGKEPASKKPTKSEKTAVGSDPAPASRKAKGK